MGFSLPDMETVDAVKLINALPQPPSAVIMGRSDSSRYEEESRAVGAAGYAAQTHPHDHLFQLISKLFGSDARLGQLTGLYATLEKLSML